MSRRVRAAILQAPQSIRVDDVALPPVGAGQVRIRLEGCGICGSNLPPWEGREWFSYPFPAGAPGHEGWGCIDAVGEGVENLRAGERVAALSYNAFAEMDVTDARQVVVLPESLAGQPFPGEALGCAMNIYRRCAMTPGETVAVVGVGFMGALLVQLAARAGAKVVAISRRPFARAMAARAGAAAVFGMDDAAATIAAVREYTRGEGAACVIEATGLQEPLTLAGELTRERGRLVIAGYHQDGPRQVNLQLWNWRGLDVINAHERDARVYIEGMRAAAEAVAAGRLDPRPLYTDSYSMEGLERGFARACARDGDFLKALVIYE